MPSKALLHVGEVITAARDLKEMGVSFGEPKVDLATLNKWKSKMVDDLVGGIGTLFKANKVESMFGVATVVDKNTVRVTKSDGGDETVVGDNLVIATGSEPVPLPGFDRNGKTVLNSDDAIALAEIPRSIVILGAGVIGLEFATIYRRLGAEVTVVEMLDRALGDTDLEISTLLLRILKKQGINIHLKTKCASVDVRSNGIIAKLQGEVNVMQEAEKMLVAVGRRPRTPQGADKLGLAMDRGFIKVDERRQTNVAGVYAVGDCTGAPLLAHKAMKEGVVAAEVIAGMKSAYDPMAMPNCVYT